MAIGNQVFSLNKCTDSALILVPSENARGGITNYYGVLRKYFPNNIIYMYRGSRNFPYKGNLFKEMYRLIKDYYKFTKKLFDNRIKLIQTTTSLNPKAVKRDAIFIIIAWLLKKKVVVFFRGWDLEYANKFGKKLDTEEDIFISDACIVLTRQSESYLREWGYRKNIFLGSTVVDDSIIGRFDVNKNREKYFASGNRISILFLSRIEKGKGVYELLEAIKILNNNYNIKLTIAGDGTEEICLKEYVRTNNINNIYFKGFVKGEEKISLLMDSHLFVLPSYTEGMPNSILEAMAVGLPVVTTKVGALNDFFINGENGYMSELPPNPRSIAMDIERLINDCSLMIKISENNHSYAKDNFLASKIAENNMNVFWKIIG